MKKKDKKSNFFLSTTSLDQTYYKGQKLFTLDIFVFQTNPNCINLIQKSYKRTLGFKKKNFKQIQFP